MADEPPPLAELQATLGKLATDHPREALFAFMETMITLLCHDPFQRDIKRRWLYVGVLQNLAKKGIR